MPLSSPRAVPAEPPPGRILIIKPSSLGDVVHALPVLALLRQAYPKAHIAWLVGASFAPLLAGHPLLNEIIPFDRGRFGKMLRSPRIFLEFCRFVGRLRRERFDLVVDLQGLIRSGFLSLASGARRRVGFRAARELAWLFYNQRVSCPAGVEHAVDKNLCVAADLGMRIDRPQFPLGIAPEELAAARQLLASASVGQSPGSEDTAHRAVAHRMGAGGGVSLGTVADRAVAHGSADANGPLTPFIAVLPGARWPTKLWQPERIAALLDRLFESGMPRCVLLGAAAESDFTQRILYRIRDKTRGHVVSLVGQTSLREMCAIIALCDQVICHDSGPMHVAAALGKPITALFGPTNAARTGPYPARPSVASDSIHVISVPVECAPCYRRVCRFPVSDNQRHHACMTGIEVETVLAAVRAAQVPRTDSHT